MGRPGASPAARPGQARPGQARPDQAGPARARPGQAGLRRHELRDWWAHFEPGAGEGRPGQVLRNWAEGEGLGVRIKEILAVAESALDALQGQAMLALGPGPVPGLEARPLRGDRELW